MAELPLKSCIDLLEIEHPNFDKTNVSILILPIKV